MFNPSNLIIAEGDTGIALMCCGACMKEFRAVMSRVTTANKTPICSKCIIEYNPKRLAMGLPAMPFDQSAYLTR
jgi:hypothetical protein